MLRYPIAALAVLLANLVTTAPAQADQYVFQLRGGGEVRGELLNEKQIPRTEYVIGLAGGGKITLAAEQVIDVSRKSDRLVEYERVRPTYPDTVKGQWDLAEWCREHLLSAQHELHLQRILDLEPEHAEARRLLGYRKLNGRWMTRDEEMIAKGFVNVRGRWMLVQEAELEEAQRRRELAEKEWHRKLNTWRKWLASDRTAEGKANIEGIKDPAALAAIRRYLDPEEETNAAVRDLFVDVVASLGTPAAMNLLVDASLNDPDEEVRLSSLEYLAKTPQHNIIRRYIDELKSADNQKINRAALGLAYMNDATAIGPLIEALVTTHKYKVVSGSKGTSAAFGGGSGGLSVGQSTKIVTTQKRNETVRNALIRISGANFDYNVDLWRSWFATQRKEQAVDTRRD